MRRTLIGLVIASLLALAFIIPVSAQGQTYGSPCTGNWWRGYENAIGDTSDGDDFLNLCNFNGPVWGDSLTIDHAPSGYCKTTGIRIRDDWNNCLSSVYVRIVDSSKILCLYTATTQSGTAAKYTLALANERRNVASSLNDQFSSFRWRSSGSSC
jgi:hypothetical protein